MYSIISKVTYCTQGQLRTDLCLRRNLEEYQLLTYMYVPFFNMISILYVLSTNMAFVLVYQTIYSPIIYKYNIYKYVYIVWDDFTSHTEIDGNRKYSISINENKNRHRNLWKLNIFKFSEGISEHNQHI